MKNIILTCMLLAGSMLAADEVLWQENFAKDGSLQDNGFKIIVNNPKDSFTVKNKEVVFHCSNKPYRGLTFQKKVQLVPQSEFYFEAKIAAAGTNGFDHSSLKIELGNMLLTFRKNKLWIHRPSKNDWIQPGKIKYNVWQKYKIRFDAANRTAEYYIDDMNIPVFVDEKSEFDPSKGDMLRLGNYGLSSGTVICALRNLKYTKFEQKVNKGNILFEEKFAVDGTPEANGFKTVVNNPKDVFSVSGGVLKMVCNNKPYRGTTIQKRVPLPAQCEIIFDANLYMEGSSGQYNNASLKIEFGNFLMAFRNGQWWNHKPSENKWLVPAKIKNNTWYTFKVRLDSTAKRAEFFVNDMTTPVFIDEKCEYDPKAKFTLMIGNYGLARGTVVNAVRNFRVMKITQNNKAQKKNDLNGTMLFAGMDVSKYPLEKYAAKFGKGQISKFNFETPAVNLSNSTNKYEISPVPPYRPASLPQCIIMADIPLDAIPAYAQKQMLEAINNGACLLIFNGLFTLNKGNFHKTEFEKILPVTVDDPWKNPVAGKGAKTSYINNTLALAMKNAGKGKVIVIMTPEGGRELLEKGI